MGSMQPLNRLPSLAEVPVLFEPDHMDGVMFLSRLPRACVISERQVPISKSQCFDAAALDAWPRPV